MRPAAFEAPPEQEMKQRRPPAIPHIGVIFQIKIGIEQGMRRGAIVSIGQEPKPPRPLRCEPPPYLVTQSRIIKLHRANTTYFRDQHQ
jgi:hypothetical protein